MKEIITKLSINSVVNRTMEWDGIQGSSYENFWRDFLNQSYGNKKEKIIDIQLNNISELGGGTVAQEIGLSPLFALANILEAKNNDKFLCYTGSRGDRGVINMFSQMLKSKIGDEIFGRDDFIKTGGGTEAITLLLDFFKNKKILQCGPGYFMQYGKGNNIETLFNEEIGSNNKGDFKMLPTIKQIDKQTKKGDVIWIIHPGISGECYSEEEGENILKIVKEKKCFLVIDTAFEGTEIEGKNIANFYKQSNKKELLEKVVFFGSPSKGEGFPGKRLGFLVSKNQEIIDKLIINAGINRDGLALNIETSAMYVFLEIFNQERNSNLYLSISKITDNVFRKFDPEGVIFSSIKENITLELIEKYIFWKEGVLSVKQHSLSKFRENIGDNKIFSGMAGKQKSIFNSFFKIQKNISKILLKKFDVNELVRYIYLYNGLLIAPGQNFGGDGKFWENKPLIVRGTFAQDYKNTEKVISKLINGIEFLLKYNK